MALLKEKELCGFSLNNLREDRTRVVTLVTLRLAGVLL
jgi:hypothetical protein